MTELQELRKLIDHIDQDICHWLDYRLSLAEKVRKLKTMVEDPQREGEILNKIEYSTDYKNIESEANLSDNLRRNEEDSV